MGSQTNISWCDATFNPWIGCTRLSEGCRFCYAEALMDKRYGKVQWGPKGTRQRTSEANWKKPLQWNRKAEKEGVRCRVFCSSLADVFEDNEQLIGWRGDLFTLISETPNLDWLLLTKRIEGWEDRLQEVAHENADDGGMLASHWLDGLAPSNVWLGTSIENQEAADKRIPELTKIPAKVLFLSCEPLLGPLDLKDLAYEAAGPEWAGNNKLVDWIIVGGESGTNARPMHPDWARSLRDQSQAAGIAFHFKQHGEYVGGYGTRTGYVSLLNGAYLCGDKNTHEWGAGIVSQRVGKHDAGRLLDMRTWDEFPQAEQA